MSSEIYDMSVAASTADDATSSSSSRQAAVSGRQLRPIHVCPPTPAQMHTHTHTAHHWHDSDIEPSLISAEFFLKIIHDNKRIIAEIAHICF